MPTTRSAQKKMFFIFRHFIFGFLALAFERFFDQAFENKSFLAKAFKKALAKNDFKSESLSKKRMITVGNDQSCVCLSGGERLRRAFELSILG